MTTHDDLRESLRAEAGRYDPQDDGWTGIQRGVRARRRRRLQGGALGGLAVAAVALGIGLSAGGGGTDVDAGRDPSALASAPEPTGPTSTSSPTTSTPSPTTSTTAVRPPVVVEDQAFPGIWPFPSKAAIDADGGSDARFEDPAATAAAFARDHVGMLDPVVGQVEDDEDGGATVELRPRGEGGEPAPAGGASTVVSLRSYPTAGGATVWTVVGARSPNIVVDEPAPGVEVGAADRVLRVRGRGTGYEGSVRAAVLQDGLRPSDVLGEAVGIMGSMGEVGPLSLDVALGAPTEPGGALLVTTDTGLDGVGVPEFTVVRLHFDEVAAPATEEPAGPRAGGPCPPVGPPGEPGPDEMDVTLYLTCDAAAAGDPGADAAFAPASRRVPRTAGVLEASLRQLVAGPTEEERRAGLSSLFSPASAGILRGVTITDGTAVVDLGATVDNASTSAGQLAFRGALDRTVFQFSTVQRIEYRLAGSCDAFWQWQQVGDCRVVTRADR